MLRPGWIRSAGIVDLRRFRIESLSSLVPPQVVRTTAKPIVVESTAKSVVVESTASNVEAMWWSLRLKLLSGRTGLS